jgi:hypothetical protein
VPSDAHMYWRLHIVKRSQSNSETSGYFRRPRNVKADRIMDPIAISRLRRMTDLPFVQSSSEGPHQHNRNNLVFLCISWCTDQGHGSPARVTSYFFQQLKDHHGSNNIFHSCQYYNPARRTTRGNRVSYGCPIC